MTDINRIVLTGTVVRIDTSDTRSGKKKVVVSLAINGKKTIYPKVLFTGELAERVITEVEPYTALSVIGRLVKFKTTNRGYVQEIVGEDFQSDKFRNKEIQYHNEAIMSGVVENLYSPFNGAASVTVKYEKEINGNTYVTHYNLKAFGELAEKLMTLEVGTNAEFKGYIAINKKEKDGKKKVFTDFIINKIKL